MGGASGEGGLIKTCKTSFGKTSFCNPEKGRGVSPCGLALDFPQTDVSPGDVNSRVCGPKELISSVKTWEDAHRQTGSSDSPTESHRKGSETVTAERQREAAVSGFCSGCRLVPFKSPSVAFGVCVLIPLRS